MALIKCKECGVSVSNKAAACTSCGAPMSKEVTLSVMGPDKKYIGAKLTEVFFESEKIGSVEQMPMVPNAMAHLTNKEYIRTFTLPSGGKFSFETKYLGKLRREDLEVPDGATVSVSIEFKRLGGMDINAQLD